MQILLCPSEHGFSFVYLTVSSTEPSPILLPQFFFKVNVVNICIITKRLGATGIFILKITIQV